MCVAPQGALSSATAMSRRHCRSLISSRSTRLTGCRWVLRCCPTTRQTRRSEARYRSCRTVTALRRHSGLRSYPRRSPTASQKPFGLELADDLLRCVPGAFHGDVPGPVWPDEDSHSPWTGCRGPRHHNQRPFNPKTIRLFLRRNQAATTPQTRTLTHRPPLGHPNGGCSSTNHHWVAGPPAP